MKLGISYNVFDGEELLEDSIKQLRNLVEYVSVIYQKTSNYGNKCDENLIPLLDRLKSNGLIDELLEYSPEINRGSHFNEIEKRNIGLKLSKKNGCTHHMSMDTDEYFINEQFKFLKDKMIEGNYDSSFCKMISYYKTSEYMRLPLEEYFVSLIYKINDTSNFNLNNYCPVIVDATRKINSVNPIIFNRDEIEMHHLSMVRDNIESKFINSSARILFNNNITQMVDDYNNWVYPNKALWPGSPPYYVEIKKVKKIF